MIGGVTTALIGTQAWPLLAGDWKQFRGPGIGDAAAGEQIPAKLKIDWKTNLPGRGLSSPIVINDRVYVTAASGPKQDRLHVFCFATKDGKTQWERQLKATGRTMAHSKTNVASCSPCSDGKHVFALWSCNDLAAFDLDGNLKWLRGLTVDYANASNSLGMASSPIVVGETVVVQIENDSESYALGIDVNTGRNLWKLERPKSANWTSPLVWQADSSSAPAVVLQSSKGVIAVDPATGSQLWEYKDGASTISSGVVSNGIVYAASKGITALKPNKNGGAPEQLWRSEQLNPATASPVLIGKRLFIINNAGVLNEANAENGERGWKLRLSGPFTASPIAAGTNIVAVSEKGLVQVVDTTAAEGAISGTLDLKPDLVDKELIVSTPSLSGGAVFVRSDSKLWRLVSE